MRLENRVNPNGDFIRSAARGALMGNRGILHDAEGRLTKRRWSHWNWVYCRTEYPGPKQSINAPGHYTQLFFLDEATALSAGHRPCGCCKRDRLEEFREAWGHGNGVRSGGTLKEIDDALHRQRVTPHREKVTFRQTLKDLPDGTMVMFPEQKGIFYRLSEGNLNMWSPFGYLPPIPASMDSEIIVLTPEPTVNALTAGFRPAVAFDKSQGPDGPFWHEEWCLKILDQLKKDFPLPEHVKLFLDFQPVKLVRSGGTTGGGICSQGFGQVSIKMAMGDSVSLQARLTRMAHEYWHAYQGQVCYQAGGSGFFGRIEDDVREFSKEYARQFMQEQGLLPFASAEEERQIKRKRLLIQLEAIVGRHFFTKHLPPRLLGPTEGKYRQPVIIRDGKKKKSHLFLSEMLTDEQLRSAFYQVGQGELRIMEALEEVLQYLEESDYR